MVLEMLAGGGLVLAGMLLGRFLPARRRHPKPPKPVCGCSHQLAFHDPATGECHGKVEVETRWDRLGDPVAWSQAQCTCRQYDGPTPLPTVYAPEVTDGRF